MKYKVLIITMLLVLMSVSAHASRIINYEFTGGSGLLLSGAITVSALDSLVASQLTTEYVASNGGSFFFNSFDAGDSGGNKYVSWKGSWQSSIGFPQLTIFSTELYTLVNNGGTLDATWNSLIVDVDGFALNDDTTYYYDGNTFSHTGGSVKFTDGGGAASPVPEPGTVMLMGSGLLGMLGFRRRELLAYFRR